LLRFQELWTQPPDELVEAGSPGLMSRGDDLLQEDGMGGPEPVALPVETDSRDWRARHLPPPLQAVVQQQQLQRTPNKQRNDRNERNERDRNFVYSIVLSCNFWDSATIPRVQRRKFFDSVLRHSVQRLSLSLGHV